MKGRAGISLIVALSLLSQAARAQTDSLRLYEMQAVMVEGAAADTSVFRGNTAVRLQWKMSSVEELPKVLGVSDPIHYAQYLPGVQTTSELNGGLYVDGCSSSHNLVSIGGVTVYNPIHFLGLFSVFNNTHYRQMEFAKICPPASGGRLGALMDVNASESIPETFGAEGSVGLISSQATLRMPLGSRSALTLSGRTTYIDELYGGLVEKFAGESLGWGYGFWDANATWVFHPGRSDDLRLDYYQGSDRLNLNIADWTADFDAKWGNRVASGLWRHHFDRGSLTQTVYATSYASDTYGVLSASDLWVSSAVSDYGYRALGVFSRGAWSFHYGGEYIRHRIQPQDIQMEGSWALGYEPQPSALAHEEALYAQTDFTPADRWTFGLSLRGSAFQSLRTDIYRAWAVDPQAEAVFRSDNGGEWRAQLGTAHQYLHQTGFSNNGLPIEYWTPCQAEFPEERSVFLTLGWQYRLGNGLELSAEAFGKRLYNQLESTSDNLTTTLYRMEDALWRGNGYAYGFNAMLQKSSGRLTGWISYSFNHSRLYFRERGYWCPTYYERPHDLTAVASYRLGKRWTLGGTLALASGAPFTPQLYAYVINGYILCEYGRVNSDRLPFYRRLDLSADWLLRERNGHRQSLNFSLYNALCSENPTRYVLSWKNDHSEYGLRKYSLLRVCLPSVSYCFKF